MSDTAQALQEQWEQAKADLLDRWPETAEPMVDELARQAEQAIADDDPGRVGQLAVSAGVVRAQSLFLAEGGSKLAQRAAGDVIAEAAGVGLKFPLIGQPGAKRVRATADAVAGLIAAGYASGAGRAALLLAGAPPAQVRDAVAEHLTELGTTSNGLVGENIGALLSAAQHSGRLAVLEEHPADGYLAVEVNDRAKCPACANVAGTRYPTLAKALADYPASGFHRCAGRLRCRGFLQPIWPSQTVKAGDHMPDDAGLARREGVELVNTGSWRLLSGSWDPNSTDILAAVEASKCPAVRRPRLKLGHLDPRFNGAGDKMLDGTPALGWFDNLRASDDGNTLLGDQVALPWLSKVQAAAWPDRSIEGTYRKRCALGHTHPFVIDAVSLLGETPPGIPTLKSIKSIEDLPAALGVAAAGDEVEDGEMVQATIRAAAEVHTGAMVALIPTTEDAERLEVEGGEPANQLHVTLAYLGEAEALGSRGRQDVIDAVSTAANGLPQFQAEAFALNVFNPPGAQRDDGKDRDTCIVLGLSGDPIDAVHDLVSAALREALWSVDVPAQHRPWHAHMTLQYTDDLGKLAELVDRIGPITFDRIRIALAGDHIDIPLIGPDEEGGTVAASTARLTPIRERIAHLEASDGVAASADPPAAPTAPAHQLPAAEPEQKTEPKEEDLVSDLSAVRSRLGLDADADLDAIAAAVDELKTKAETTEQQVAASAATEAEKDELRKEVTILASQVQTMSSKLADAEAEKATTIKASVFDAAVKDGKITPADREQWEKDYDEAPGAVTRVLASIAVGTAVPVLASGIAGDPEPTGASFDDTEYNRLFGIPQEA